MDGITELVREGQIHHTQVACSIRGPLVMVKSIQVPRMTTTELEEHLEWDMDQYMAADVTEIHWDYCIADSCHQEASGAMMSVLLVAAKKEAVVRRKELLQRAGLDPIVVDVDHLALSNMHAFNSGDGDPKGALLISASPSGIGMIVVDDGYPIYVRDVEVGRESYRTLYDQSCRNPLDGTLSIDGGYGAESQRILLNDIYREVSVEVRKTIDYCGQMVPHHPIERLYLCGGYAGLPSLAKTIEAEVSVPIEFLNPFKKLKPPPELHCPDDLQRIGSLAGVAIGLALRGMDG